MHRSDNAYSGPATRLAPDLIVGYSRGFRASWATCLGEMTEEILLDNHSAWSADHCTDASEVPGGEYFVLQYITLFENKKSVTEAVSVIKDNDGSWRILGYSIQ